jgi:glycerol kinase
VVRPQITETTALGAAYLAGLATGVFRDTAELAALWRADRTFLPAMSRRQAMQAMAQWEEAVRKVRPD